MSPQFVPDLIAVALDGAGNRVYAYPASSNVRIVRTGPTGAPNAATFKNVPANARSVSLAVNPAGDVLVAWTSDNTSDETGIVFWAHDKAEPNAPQLQPKLAGASNATPFAALDPDRHAVVAYQQDGKLVQTQSANAGTTPFGPPSTLSSGQRRRDDAARRRPTAAPRSPGTSRTTMPPNQYALEHRASTSTPACAGSARPFAAPQLVDGSDDIDRRLLRQQRGRDLPHRPGDHRLRHATSTAASSLTCAQTLGEQKTRGRDAQITPTGEGGFAAQVLAGGGNVNGLQAARGGRTGRAARRVVARARRAAATPTTTSVAGAAFGAQGPAAERRRSPARRAFVGALALPRRRAARRAVLGQLLHAPARSPR